MRIVLWSHGFVRAVGGAERVVRSLALHLDSEGHEILIVSDGTTADPPGAGGPLPASIGIFAATLPNPLLLPWWQRPLAMLRYLKGALGVTWRFFRWRPELVHLHVVNLDVFLLIFLRRLLRNKLVLTFHGLELELASQDCMSSFKLRQALRAADAVTAVSQEIRDRLNTQWGADAVHLPNGVEFGSIESPCKDSHEPGTFVFCGNLRTVKGVDLLLAAWKRGIEHGLKSRLLLIGDGECRSALERLAENYGLGTQVHFLGQRPHDEAMSILSMARCLVLSSWSEACPLTVLEAAALGKPVIAPAVGGLPELVESEKTGLLYVAGDVVSLSERVERLARDPQLSAAMGRRAYHRLRKSHSKDKVLPLYSGLYARLFDECTA